MGLFTNMPKQEVEVEDASPHPPTKKSKKPLPPGYACNCCGAVELHAVYDCPDRVAQPKEDRKIPEQSKLTKFKVHISGLPFSTTVKSLMNFLNEGCTSVDLQVGEKDIKLVSFTDNPKKCKGLAFVSAATERLYNRLLSINGRLYDDLIIKVEKISTTNLRKPEKDRLEKRCYRCGEYHDPQTCSNERICYRCRQTGHLSKFCPLKGGGDGGDTSYTTIKQNSDSVIKTKRKKFDASGDDGGY